VLTKGSTGQIDLDRHSLHVSKVLVTVVFDLNDPITAKAPNRLELCSSIILVAMSAISFSQPVKTSCSSLKG